MIVLFINCSLFPFVSWIMSGLKTYETRNKNTLKSLIGKSIYIAETGKGKPPVIRCCCTISGLVTITTRTAYDKYRKQTMIKRGSAYDFTHETRKKYLYRLENVQAVKPFELPGNAVRHGRIYAEIPV